MQIGQILGCRQMQVTHIVIVRNCCCFPKTSCCECCSLLLYQINIALIGQILVNPWVQADAGDTYCYCSKVLLLSRNLHFYIASTHVNWPNLGKSLDASRCQWHILLLSGTCTNPQLPEQQHIYVCMNTFVQLTHKTERDTNSIGNTSKGTSLWLKRNWTLISFWHIPIENREFRTLICLP